MPKQLKLFAVQNVRTGELVKSNGRLKYYNNKRVAKHERDGLIEDTGQMFKIVLGPDHRRFRRNV